MTDKLLRWRRAALSALAIAAVASLSACGGEDAAPGPAIGAAPTPTPTPPPATAQFAPRFGLTADRVLDVFGWQVSGNSQVPATNIGMRWNAQASSFEIMLPGQEWGRLVGPTPYSIYNLSGALQPESLNLNLNQTSLEGSGGNRVPSHALRAGTSTSLFVFGIASAAGAVPTTGTRTCRYNVDDDGDGTLTVDLAAGRIGGTLGDFYGGTYVVPQAAFTPGSTTLSFPGGESVVDARFFGPAAQELAVRWVSRRSSSVLAAKLFIMLCDSP